MLQIYAIILKYNAERRKNCEKSTNRERKNVARVFCNTFGVLQNTFGLLTDSLGVLSDSI
jgi:Co/Zn/Cd efflux system component